MSDKIFNALTVDVEDWYHVCGVDLPADIPRRSGRAVRNVDAILVLLERHDCRATFFMLGSLAESEPGLAPRIAAAGHEVASHGWSHQVVPLLTRDQFREELQRTSALLELQTGQRPVGYRAPQWSLSSDTPWAFSVLRDEGFCYDSSLNPLAFVGNPRGCRVPYPLSGEGAGLWEIPPMVTPSLLGNLPTGGGWGFRLFPFGMIKRTIERCNHEHCPAVLYLHPREVDPCGPRLDISPAKRFVSYGTRSDASPRLELLLQRFRFTTLKELVDSWQSVS